MSSQGGGGQKLPLLIRHSLWTAPYGMYTYTTVVIKYLEPEFKFPAKIDLTFSQILAIAIPIVSR